MTLIYNMKFKKSVFINIKNFFLLSILFFLFLSCETISPKYQWYTPKEVIENQDRLEPGDILILSKRNTLRSMWGHSAVLNEDKKIVEFPSYSNGYSESPLFAWQNVNRKVAIFRLKGIDDNFKNALFKEIDSTVTKPYGLTFDKNFDKRLYCSQFVYLVFKNAGINVGKDINLDSDGGGWVMPFDIMDSPLLENITLY